MPPSSCSPLCARGIPGGDQVTPNVQLPNRSAVPVHLKKQGSTTANLPHPQKCPPRRVTAPRLPWRGRLGGCMVFSRNTGQQSPPRNMGQPSRPRSTALSSVLPAQAAFIKFLGTIIPFASSANQGPAILSMLSPQKS